MFNIIKLKYAKKYLSETYRFTRKYRSFNPVKNLIWFDLWLKSNAKGKSPLLDKVPWITFSSISFLNNYLKEGMKVFEFGTGGSTLFFLERGTNVVSIEHDVEWAAKVRESVNSDSKEWVLTIVEPDLEKDFSNRRFDNPYDYISSDKRYFDMSFRKYVSTIDSYPDKFFDLIMIDGRARPSCLVHALKKVNVGGVIVLDNTDRERYLSTMNLIKRCDFNFFDFPGASPYVNFFTRTSAWMKI